VTEFCHGGELFEQITKRSSYSEADAAKIFKQVLAAISYCHSMQIVHRDLKLENLFYDEQTQNLKVIDFGTSHIYDPSKKLHHTYGTPYYIAPEVL
jgi:calcium-dependent protein kinase